MSRSSRNSTVEQASYVKAVVFLLALTTLSSGLGAQTVGGEWLSYAGDARSTKYSPLDQINQRRACGDRETKAAFIAFALR